MTLDLSGGLVATDKDGDAITINSGSLLIEVEDDIPVQTTATVVGSVQEDALSGGNLDNTAADTTIATGNISGLVSVGADASATYSVQASGLPTLTSNGNTVTYSAVDTNSDTITDKLVASASGSTVFTLELNQTSGAYTFTLLDQLDHPVSNSDDTEIMTLDLSGGLVATDKDGDQITINASSLLITVEDDIPIARNDSTLYIKEGSEMATSVGNLAWNLLTSTNPSGGATSWRDYSGADESITITRVDYVDSLGASQFKILSGGTTGELDTKYGKLTVFSDGEWQYTPDPWVNHSTEPVSETITYTITDRDGDTATATKTLVVEDTATTISDPLDNSVYERNLSTGSDPNPVLLVKTGTLGVNKQADPINVVFNGAPPPTGITSNKKTIFYHESPDGHTLTATDLEADGGNVIFTIEIKNYDSKDASYEFTLYRAVDHLYEDQNTGATISHDPIEFPIRYKVLEPYDNDTVLNFPSGVNGGGLAEFTVTIYDDTALVEPLLTFQEDEPDPGERTMTVNADARSTNLSITGTPAAHGTVQVNDGTISGLPDGTITYTPFPNTNYSGTDTFEYTLEIENTSTTEIRTVTVTVIPVSDAPGVTALDYTLSTLEDTQIDLRLYAPTVGDKTDQNGIGTAGDDPERLGAITLSGIPVGAKIFKADGTTLVFEATTGHTSFTVMLVSGGTTPVTGTDSKSLFLAETTANSYLTVLEYEGLKLLPPPNSGNNFSPAITVSVTEYEVDAAGYQKEVSGVAVPGVTTTATIAVEVLAVTDIPPAPGLLIDGFDTPYTANFEEDTVFDLGALLSTTSFDDTTDGSEHREIVLSGLLKDTIVTSNALPGPVTIGATGTVTIPLINSTVPAGIQNVLPGITITPPPNFSGEMNGITVTLQALDTDPNLPAASPVPVSWTDSVTLNLLVLPVADDIAAPDVSTSEDQSVRFLKDLRVTDISSGLTTGGTEIITAITVSDLALGWVIKNPSGTVVFTGDGTADFSIPVGDYTNYTVTPPPHSSADTTVKVLVTTTDTATIQGIDITDNSKIDQLHNIKVTVTPVAEAVAGSAVHNGTSVTVTAAEADSDVSGTADLAINPHHTYTTHGTEGQFVSLTEAGSSPFAIGSFWHNEDADGSERTYALFTPTYLVGGVLTDMIEAEFQYTDGSGVHTEIFKGTPIAVEMPYLHTVSFKAKPGYSGAVTIDVQAKTVDHGPDDTTTDVFNVSGLAHLDFIVDPVPNQVTLAVTSPVPIDEDLLRTLSIRPTSTDTDGSESFTITITGIPNGSEMIYDGSTIYAITDTSGTVTINHFDSSKTFTIQPPHNSNEDITLHVTGHTVEVLDPTNPGTICQPLDIIVDVRGVADPVDVVTTVAGFSEQRLDSLPPSDLISMSSLISVTRQDTDGSETLSFYFTGLANGFDISGVNVSFLGGTGTERRWLLTPGDFAGTTMTVPKNFSGTVTFQGVPVTSENDGNSWTGDTWDPVGLRWTNNTSTGDPIPLSLTVSPSPEATIVDHTVFNEDQWILTDPLNPVMGAYARVNFDLLPQPLVDTNEVLTSVWIKAADVDGRVFTLSYDADDAGAGSPIVLGAVGGILADDGYYKLTAEQSKHIYVQNTHDLHGSYTFEVQYAITDPTSDGTTVRIINPATGGWTGVTANSVTTQSTIAAYTLTVNAVTDPITDPLGTISAADETSSHTVISGDVVTVYGSTVLTVPVVVTQSNYLAENPDGQDLDGSEMLERFIIDGVPDGITVVGATYVGDTGTTPNTGRWILDVNPDLPFTSTIPRNIAFDFDGVASQFIGWSKTITITAESRDTGSGIRSASVSFTIDNSLVVSFDDSGRATNIPAAITPWGLNTVSMTEDTASMLADLATVAISSITDSSPFSITLKNVQAGTIVTGMERMVLPGDEVIYTASGSGGDATLQTLLHNITLTPPPDSNENNHNDLFVFDLALTTYAPGGQQNTEKFHGQIEVLPDSDPTTSVITPRAGSEYEDDTTRPSKVDSGAGVLFTVAFENAADGSSNQLLGNVMLVIDERSMDSYLGGLVLTDDGTGKVLTLESSGGGFANYSISGVLASDVLTLTYFPVPNASGSIEITASVNSRETGSVQISGTPGSLTIDVIPVIDGYNPTSIVATGPEDTRIQLAITGGGLIDLDGSESVQSILLKKLHNCCLVYIGDDAASAVLALNAGSDASGHNTWSIGKLSTITGKIELPNYVAIVPPNNLSGTVEGLELVVITTETHLPGELLEQTFLFDTVVTPVSDGLTTISPTHSFGPEGQMVPINLNVSMADFDGSETATVTLRGFRQYASFYGASGTELTLAQFNPATDYNSGTDTYTLHGLTVEDTNALSVIQSATNGTSTVYVAAYTVDGAAPQSVTTPEKSFTLNISPIVPTTSNDTLLYDGVADLANTRSFDGLAGTDTLVLRKGEDIDFADSPVDRSIFNIEYIDLTVNGNHSLSNITSAGVAAMTDPSTHDLYILGDGGDHVAFTGADWSTATRIGDYNVYTSSTDPTVKVSVYKDIL
ncbi:MAG: hypothetical protein J0648_07390 [Pelodictyon phaeoclathratiforme]|nr:hypothetical protein [Pelodictyon phaeoclathratiforme]